ncbi:MAG: ATPase domain-containing protein [Candidatus Micrarchaeia archaeon]
MRAKKQTKASKERKVVIEAPEPPKEKEVAVEEQALMPTGIPGLDDIVGGGFRRGNVIAVGGGPGTGKTTFALQFLVNGIRKYGEPGMFISFEETKHELLGNMSSYDWNLEELEKEGKLIFLNYMPHDVDRFINDEFAIENTIREHGVKRLAVDSISSLATIYESEKAERIGFLRMTDRIKTWGCTTILVLNTKTNYYGEIISHGRIEFLADGLIYLYRIRKDEKVMRALEVLKMRGAKISDAMHRFEFTKGGIAVVGESPSREVSEVE